MNRVMPVKPATYQDILDAPEGLVAQIINGALYTQPRPASPHALASSTLGMMLGNPFQLGVGGPGGWTLLDEPELHLAETDIYVPDLAGWRLETMPEFEVAPYIKTIPDWVCEVLSPSTRMFDLTEKRDTYAKVGVEHLWIVDPDARTLEAFVLRDSVWTLQGTWRDDAAVDADPFKAITIDLAHLWPNPPAV